MIGLKKIATFKESRMSVVDLTQPVLKFDHRQLSQDELNSIWSPHKCYWDNLTKDEVKTRKEEWKLIQRSLKEYGATEFRGSYLKQHKELYFTGNVSPELIADSGRQGSLKCSATFSLFYLWYHPGLTQDLCVELIQYFAQPFFSLSGRLYDLERMRSQLFYRIGQGDYTQNGEYGFMGKRMSVIVPNLLGYNGEEGVIDAGTNVPPFPSSGAVRVIAGSCRAFITPELCIYRPGDYLWPQGSYYLKGYLEEYRNLLKEQKDGFESREAALKNNLIRSAEVILGLLIQRIESLLFFSDIAEIKHDHPNAIACYELIMGQYKNGEFSPCLNSAFDLIKNKGISKVKPKHLLEII